MSKEEVEWTEQENRGLLALIIAFFSLYMVVLCFAFCNLWYMYKLRIKKKLILLLYTFCILKEISTAVWFVAYDKKLTNQYGTVSFYTWTISSFFDLSTLTIVILTNYHLATSI